MAKVSIILPIYNVEDYIKECLDSIVNQTLKDIEIICINDGSTDNSLKIIEEYAAEDSRFIIVSQENQGQGVARNKGIEFANGEYLTFVDPDDWIELDAMETLYNYMKEHNAQVVQFEYKEFNDYSRKYSKHDWVSEIYKNNNFDLSVNESFTWKDIRNGCLYRSELHVWTRFYLTKFVKDNHIVFAPTKHGEDHLFALGVLLKADKIYYLNKALYTYRCRRGSSVNIKSDMNFGIFTNIELLKKFLIENDLYEELEDEFKDYMLNVMGWHYKLVLDSSRERFKNCCLELITEKEFKELKAKLSNYKFIERIFSLKNERIEGIKYKVITILGIKIKIKPKRGVV